VCACDMRATSNQNFSLNQLMAHTFARYSQATMDNRKLPSLVDRGGGM